MRLWRASVLLAALLVGCARQEPERSPAPDSIAAAAAPESTVTAPAVPPPPPPDTVRVPRYERVAVGDAKRFQALQKQLGPERLAMVLKLNRVDRNHVRDRDSLVVPDSLTIFRELSPFPVEIPSQKALAKLLLVSLRVQAFAAYDSGQLVRWGPTSTGRESLATPAGLYHTNWKDKQRISTFNDEWELKWYVNLHNFLGISLHEYELPGYPASHSCVRLDPDDAEWLYGWSEQWRLDRDPRHIVRQGTPVVIFGRYAFGKRRPWRNLPIDPRATAVTIEEIEESLHSHGLSPGLATAARDTVATASADADTVTATRPPPSRP